MQALRIALPVPLRKNFDYLPPENFDPANLKPGVRILVPFKKRELVGILLEVTTNPELPFEKLKRVLTILDEETFFTPEIWRLCHWTANYYHYPIGEVLSAALPAALRKGKALKNSAIKFSAPSSAQPKLELNYAQQQSLNSICAAANKFQVFLLDGITGSGKTEVYLQAIEFFLAEQKQILVLVPEISLTPQTMQRFSERFRAPIASWHSGMTEKQRLNTWVAAKNDLAKIVIGTRSAIFTPFTNLGLIIVDEEHDLSFKQQDGLRYNARDLAIMRAHFNNIPIILGSATPALESLQNAMIGRYTHLKLKLRAGNAALPKMQILDMRNAKLEEGISASLLAEMKQHLQQGQQVMLFLNRRGFAPVLMCHACGWNAKCKRCDARMTYHQKPLHLHCHHCDSQSSIFKICPECAAKDLITVGHGTERLEEVIAKYFPDISIARLDRDTTRRKGALQNLLDKINHQEHRILIGTQMLAKGHHFPEVSLVAIIDSDGGLFSSDFRALERMGQLITQVAGRAGRAATPGKVIIQTHHPEHPLLAQLLRQDYAEFAQIILTERKIANLPPYVFFALFRAEAYNMHNAGTFLQQVKTILNSNANRVEISGPIAAPMLKRAGRYHAQLLLHSKERVSLHDALKLALPEIEKLQGRHRVHWSLDMDPLEMF